MSGPKRRLIDNVLSLATLQASTYLAPLIILPYLVRTLGPANYGEVVFSQALIQFFILFTDWGLSHNGAREIAVLRDDRTALNRYFWDTFFMRAVLLGIAAFILALLCLCVHPFNLYPLLHVFTFGMVAADILTPLYFFQGMERMRFFAGAGIAVRLLTIAVVFAFVHTSGDFMFVTLLYSLCYLAGGVLTIAAVIQKAGFPEKLPSTGELLARLRANGRIFATSVSITAGNAGNTLLLRLFCAPDIVGIYAAAEKLVMGAVGLANPVLQSLLPYISRLAATSRQVAVKRVTTAALAASLAGAFFFVLAAAGGGTVIGAVLGESFGRSVHLFILLSALPAGFWATMTLGNLYFLAFGKYRAWSNIFISISAAGVLLTLLFVAMLNMGANGLTYALLIRVYAGLILIAVLFVRSAQSDSAGRADAAQFEPLQ